MLDVTRILLQIKRGDPQAAENLLPLVYDELRKLAAAKLAQGKPGQTFLATALVHEAYVKMIDGAPTAAGIVEGTSLVQPPRRCGEFFLIAFNKQILSTFPLIIKQILKDDRRLLKGHWHSANR